MEHFQIITRISIRCVLQPMNAVYLPVVALVSKIRGVSPIYTMG